MEDVAERALRPFEPVPLPLPGLQPLGVPGQPPCCGQDERPGELGGSDGGAAASEDGDPAGGAGLLVDVRRAATGLGDHAEQRRSVEDRGVDPRPLADEDERLDLGEVLVARRTGEDDDVVSVQQHERVERPDDVLVVVGDDDPRQLGRGEERRERPCLADRLVAAEQRRLVSAHRRGEVLDLELVPPRRREVDPLDRVAAVQLQHALVAPERGRQAQRPLRPRDLDLVPPRQVEAAVEVPEHVVRKAEDGGEAEVDAGRADDLLGAHDLGLAGHEPGDVDAVAADVEERPAAELGAQTDVAGPDERERELRANEAERADCPPANELLQPLRLRLVPVHEALHQHEPRPLGDVEGRAPTSSGCVENGFSTSTCFPASSARVAHSTWSAHGRAT